MSASPTISASYSVASSSSESTFDSNSATGPLNFEAPIRLSTETTPDPSKPAAQVKKEQYLTALAAALSGLQDSINTGLTERLVQQGILSETTDNDPSVNTKLRTKVPGQPNNGKKGQTKKQQQREQKQKEQNQALSGDNATTAESAGTPMLRSLTPSSTTSTSMEVETSSTSESAQDAEMQVEEQYRPKGGIYGDDDDEDKQDMDEVDLVMEADPGEVDGACLELPKEQGAQQQQESQNKKRNELPTDSVGDLAAAKKSRGSEDD